MKNFIFISPDFPKTYYQFTKALKEAGFRVLGIAQSPYDSLPNELKDSMHEYYRVNNLESYDEVFKAVAFFSFKYGHIDYLESNNEYWLRQDAMLRKDFNIKTGKMGSEINAFQNKELEKKYYKLANVKVARYIIPTSYKKTKEFIDEVGYPVIVKPVIGVGASKTYRINNDIELKNYFDNKPSVKYIMEEYIDGELISFDGVSNSKCEVVFYSNEVFPDPVMDVVNERKDFIYYSNKECPLDLKDAGERVVKAFKAKNRYFHLEFFRLKNDKKGLGKKGDLLGLEVNMRPPGGYTPDLINYSKSVNSYKIWAEVMMYDTTYENQNNEKYYAVYVGRRFNNTYKHSGSEILETYKYNITLHEHMPYVLTSAMGDDAYFAKFKTMEDVQKFIEFVEER